MLALADSQYKRSELELPNPTSPDRQQWTPISLCLVHFAFHWDTWDPLCMYHSTESYHGEFYTLL